MISKYLFPLLVFLSVFLSAQAAPPNIVYILADDMGYGDVSAYNPGSKIQTPHIDTLAAQGIRFTDMHSTSSVCTPTRYGIMTGRYCWRSSLKVGVTRGYGRVFLRSLPPMPVTEDFDEIRRFWETIESSPSGVDDPCPN
jgi:hypothetical protein